MEEQAFGLRGRTAKRALLKLKKEGEKGCSGDHETLYPIHEKMKSCPGSEGIRRKKKQLAYAFLYWERVDATIAKQLPEKAPTESGRRQIGVSVKCSQLMRRVGNRD